VGELVIDLDHLTDIGHQHQRRAPIGGTFGTLQRAGEVLGQRAGAQHPVVEAEGVACGAQFFDFEHEGAAAAAVDTTGTAAAIAVAKSARALEHVVLLGCGMRGHLDQLARLAHKALRGAQLGGGHAAPLGDEGGGMVVVRLPLQARHPDARGLRDGQTTAAGARGNQRISAASSRP
jgi:hypothetical protein